jgi:hypothetical protein
MGRYDAPDWRALEGLLGADELCAHFMWMFNVLLEDGTMLNAYKHRWTRCYFHLANDGRAFYYATGERDAGDLDAGDLDAGDLDAGDLDADVYAEVDPHTAIKAVFADWECCKPRPEERRALRAALRRAAARTRSD